MAAQLKEWDKLRQVTLSIEMRATTILALMDRFNYNLSTDEGMEKLRNAVPKEARKDSLRAFSITVLGAQAWMQAQARGVPSEATMETAMTLAVIIARDEPEMVKLPLTYDTILRILQMAEYMGVAQSWTLVREVFKEHAALMSFR